MRQAQFEPRSPPKKPGIYLLDDDFDMFMTNPRNAPLHKEDYIVLEEDAILPGGAVSLLSKDAIAIFIQYAAVGVIYGGIAALSFPLIKIYFGAQGYQTRAYNTLVNLPWSFKLFMGALSDCVPICGLRRKPWILLGWCICLVSLVALACLSPGETSLTTKVPNDHLSTYTLLSIVASFGYVTSDCASDALVVTYAMREPLAIRGRIQTAIYTCRTVGEIFSYLLVGILLNSPKFGGHFDFSIAINVIYIILCVPCAMAMASASIILTEHKTETVPFRKWIRQFWQLLQKQAMWQVLAFRFVSSIFQNFDSVAVSPMGQYWANVQPFMDGIAKAIGRVFYTLVLVFVGRFGLNWNWRWTIAIATICLIAIDGTVYFLTIWDVVRDPWFYTGVKLTDQLPTGVRFIVSAFVATELADLGNEGAVYGLVTTVSNLASPVSSAFYKFVDGFFELQDASFQLEKTTTSTDVRNRIRWQVSYSFIVAYGMKLFALVWLVLLPPQKAHVQRLKRYGIVSRFAGGLSMVLFGSFLTFSVFTNLTSIFDATSWWRIAGGDGVRPTPKPPTTKSPKLR